MVMDMILFYFSKLLNLVVGVHDIYVGILTIAGVGFLSYMGVMLIVDFPLLAIEEITKKKLPSKFANRLKLILAVCATLYFTYILYTD